MRFPVVVTFSLLSIFASANIAASDVPSTKACGAHTWHSVFASKGEWKASLQVINESDHAWFVNPECAKINSLKVTPSFTPKYGFVFDNKADFNVAYTLTFTEQSASAARFSSKSCVFIVTAKGPAQPDIAVNSYNGAKCDWKVVPGVGEDFYVG